MPLTVTASIEIYDHVNDLYSIWKCPFLFHAPMHPNTRRTLINHFCVSKENQLPVIIFVNHVANPNHSPSSHLILAVVNSSSCIGTTSRPLRCMHMGIHIHIHRLVLMFAFHAFGHIPRTSFCARPCIEGTWFLFRQ